MRLAGILISFFVISSCIVHGPGRNCFNANSGFNPKYEPAIDSILEVLTLQEKIALIHGCGLFVSSGVKRLGLPELYYTDGITGIREEMERDSWKPMGIPDDSATFFPIGTALAATWNTELALHYGEAIGNEARARNKDILLAPSVNIIRTPLCGRNYEYFTEDPFLNSLLAVEYIRGVQKKDVAACIKHYALNNQEQNRNLVNVIVSERALREIYLPVYKSAVQEGGVYAVMASYNKFKGDWLSENDYLLNKILKNEWGFQGIVVSDWGGTHSTAKAAMSGLDLEMATRGAYDQYYFGNALIDSVKSGVVPEEVIDDKVRRVLRVMLNCKTRDAARFKGQLNSSDNMDVAYDIASEAVVLLKNDHILPLDSLAIKSIAVIGDNAVHKQASGGFGAGVKAKYEITPLEGLKSKAGSHVKILFTQGYEEKYIPEGDMYSSFFQQYPDSTANQALVDDAVALAGQCDVTIVFAGTNRRIESEAKDRKDFRLPFGQDRLISAVTKANPNTIIVVISGGACDLNTINKKAKAVVYAWFNGSEAGNALADVLFGSVNPSGKLPYTIPVKLEDIPAHALNAYPGESERVEYKEDILVGYRWFDTKEIQPLYCFGHGLSYTTFFYSAAKTDKYRYHKEDTIHFTVKIKNTGKTAGKEIIQLYVNDPEASVLRPQKELKAFAKVYLASGEEKEVLLNVEVKNLAFFDDNSMRWIVEPGKYKLLTGSSSRDIRRETDIEVLP